MVRGMIEACCKRPRTSGSSKWRLCRGFKAVSSCLHLVALVLRNSNDFATEFSKVPLARRPASHMESFSRRGESLESFLPCRFPS